jgi:hypothetical protein
VNTIHYILIPLFLTLILLTTATVYLIRGIYHGNKTKKINDSPTVSLQPKYKAVAHHTALHKKHINHFLISALCAVGSVRWLVIASGGEWGSTWLFYVHMALVIGFTGVTFSMRFIWNGMDYPTKHKKLVKWFVMLFLAVLTTGTLLLSQMPRMQEVMNTLQNM